MICLLWLILLLQQVFDASNSSTLFLRHPGLRARTVPVHSSSSSTPIIARMNQLMRCKSKPSVACGRARGIPLVTSSDVRNRFLMRSCPPTPFALRQQSQAIASRQDDKISSRPTFQVTDFRRRPWHGDRFMYPDRSRTCLVAKIFSDRSRHR
ncbi:hypothetical protein D3C87_1441430 [compost metagenome]